MIAAGLHDDGWGGFFGGEIVTGPTLSSADSYGGMISGPASFGSGGGLASSGSGDIVGTAADCYEDGSGCDRWLIVRRGYVSGYFSIEQRDLQRQDFCNPGRNTGHLRMDVGKRSEPELHASDPCTAAATNNWASGRHHQSRNLDRKLCSQTERLGESARIDYQRLFSIWNNERLRTHYRPAKSHWEHLPKYQCAILAA